MAIAFSQGATATQKQGSSPITATIPTTGQAADDYVLVCYSGITATTGITFDGTAMTALGSARSTNNVNLRWYGLKVTTETGGAISASYSGGGDTAMVGLRFSGVHTTTPVLQSNGTINALVRASMAFDTTGAAGQLTGAISAGSMVITGAGGDNGKNGPGSHTGHTVLTADASTQKCITTRDLTPSPTTAGSQETGTLNFDDDMACAFETLEIQEASAATSDGAAAYHYFRMMGG